MAEMDTSTKSEGLPSGINEAVCIDTNRVYDSCADKDCLSDLRVYFTNTSQQVINGATSVKCKKSEIINAYIDVQDVPFNRGFYSVDITYFFKITLDVCTSRVAPPVCVSGLATFTKKCILYGSDGNVKGIFIGGSLDNPDKQPCGTNANPRKDTVRRSRLP